MPRHTAACNGARGRGRQSCILQQLLLTCVPHRALGSMMRLSHTEGEQAPRSLACRCRHRRAHALQGQGGCAQGGGTSSSSSSAEACPSPSKKMLGWRRQHHHHRQRRQRHEAGSAWSSRDRPRQSGPAGTLGSTTARDSGVRPHTLCDAGIQAGCCPKTRAHTHTKERTRTERCRHAVCQTPISKQTRLQAKLQAKANGRSTRKTGAVRGVPAGHPLPVNVGHANTTRAQEREGSGWQAQATGKRQA